MRRIWISNRALWGAMAMLALVIGCQPAEDKQPSETPPASSEPAETTATSVVPTEVNGDRSPADPVTPQVAADLSPEGVCTEFMALLQSGNRISAENLLTRASLMNTTRAGLKLEPMGGPHAKVEIGEVRFATNKQELAQVDCRITDSTSGQYEVIELTWLVRRSKKSWRISGVMLELEPGQKPDLLSFENIQDVARIKSFAGEEVINETTTRQAHRPGTADTEIK